MAPVKRGIKSQIISVIEHISKVRFGWLEDKGLPFFLKLIQKYVKVRTHGSEDTAVFLVILITLATMFLALFDLNLSFDACTNACK